MRNLFILLLLLSFSAGAFAQQFNFAEARASAFATTTNGIATASASASASVSSGDGDSLQVIQGVPATGANIFLDQVLWEFPNPWNQVTVISSGAFNADGSDNALDLVSGMPANTLIVNKVDPVLAAFPNLFPQNIPLRDIPMFINAAFDRGDPPSVFDAPRDELTRSWPNVAITLGEWQKASGTMIMQCSGNDASVSITFRNLIPNGLYTVWATSGTDAGGLTAVPFGGAPNVFVPDANGNGTWERELNGCPTDTDGVANPLLLLEVAYHSDNNIYGGVPDSAVTGLPFGLSTNTHLNFPINIVGPATND